MDCPVPDPAAQGAEERWKLTVCAECGVKVARCHYPHRGTRLVEVVPLSRAQKAEAERDKFREIAGRYNAGWEKRCDAAEIERDALRARLEAVEGTLREWVRNGRWPGDSEVEALADRAALNPERAVECERCKGSGTLAYYSGNPKPPDSYKCPTCGGTGRAESAEGER